MIIHRQCGLSVPCLLALPIDNRFVSFPASPSRISPIRISAKSGDAAETTNSRQSPCTEGRK